MIEKWDNIFGKSFRQTASNRWVEKWDNFFSENYLDKQPQTDEFQEDVLLLINA